MMLKERIYPGCEAHALYYIANYGRPVGLCHILSHYIINGTIYGKKSY